MAESIADLLTCPNTGKPCSWYHACASRKEIIDEGENPLGIFADEMRTLPVRVQEVLLGDEYCIDERINRLSAIALDADADTGTRFTARKLADGLVMSRGMFPGEGPADVRLRDR